MERRKHTTPGKEAVSIGNVLQQYTLVHQQQEAKPRCRFDMFVRYNQREKRNKPEFCYRGDFFEKDPEKMLWSLLRMFINNYGRFFLSELYDNTKAKDDPDRVILKYHNGSIIENRLKLYSAMLNDHPVPQWLK